MKDLLEDEEYVDTFEDVTVGSDAGAGEVLLVAESLWRLGDKW